MAKQSSLRIEICFVAVVLLSASATQTTFAQSNNGPSPAAGPTGTPVHPRDDASQSGHPDSAIDTSITVQEPPKFGHPTWVHDGVRQAAFARDRSKIKVAKPSEEFGGHHPASAVGTKVDIPRNAIGMRVQMREVRKGPDANVFTPAAVVSATNGTAVFAGSGGADARRSDSGRQIAVPTPAFATRTNGSTIKTTVNHSVGNRIGMSHQGTGIGAIGGATKAVAGINGTMVRSKHY
jgi:hypothetical protein